MKDYFQLRKNLKKDFSKLPLIKMAVLGDTATQFLCNTIRALGCEKKLNIEIWEADYNQIETQILVNSSELYKFNADIIVLFFATHKLLDSYNKLNPSQYNTLALTEKERIIKLLDIIKENTSAQVIIYNYYHINDAVFGSYGLKTESSFIFQLHKLNYELMTLATQRKDMLLCDISTLKSWIGEKTFFQPSLYLNSDMVLSLDVLPEVASRTVDIVCSLNARIKKCVIIDLDNTIWGGLIGEDGI